MSDANSMRAPTEAEVRLYAHRGAVDWPEASVRDMDLTMFAREIEALRTQLAEARTTKWNDTGYLMSIIDAAIEDGFDPDEDGQLLDEIRAELKAHSLSQTPNTEEISSVVTGREG